jgi:hypothetical protein
LSPLRRVMCDFMALSRRSALVAIERRVPFGELVEARRHVEPRPSWFAVFIKAYALVTERRAELRRSYLSFPTARLHQHACNVAHLAVSRQVEGDDVVLGIEIRYPERLPLAEIDAYIRRAQNEPVTEFADFRRVLRLSRLPGPLRRLALWAALNVSGELRARYFGTFGITGVAALGSTALHVLTPLTTALSYGVLAADGSVPIRLFFDHRVLDGVSAARALEDLDGVLHGPILDELRDLARRAA